jgi:hypothetical protein
VTDQPDQPDQTELLITALSAAQRAGNPVPGGDPRHWQRIIRVARRNWSSFTARHPAPAPDTLAARAEDLARGLLARCRPQSAAGRPIDISDCRTLARRLAIVLSSAPETGSAAGRIRANWLPQ